MSLAQRRTTLDGVEEISLPTRASVSGRDEEGGSDFTESTTVINDQQQQQQQQYHVDSTNNINEEVEGSQGPREDSSETTTLAAAGAPATVPAEDGKEIWKTVSYDPFGPQGPPELHHYESFPAELGDNVAAYEVSTVKRVGE